MKKIVLVVALVLLALILGMAIFVATFNADRYRPLLTKKIEDSLGKKAAVGRLSLVWKDGLALEIDGLKLYPDASGGGKPAAELESITANVRLMPLLQKNIEIASIVMMKPRVAVERGADGVLSAGGISAPSSTKPVRSSKNSPAVETSPGIPPIKIGSLRIEKGEIDLIDRSSAAPLHLKVSDLDVRVKNFSLTAPFSFDAHASVFGRGQNISIAGQFRMPQANAPGILEKFLLKTDLGALDMSEIAQSFPGVASSGLQALSGKLEAAVDNFSLDPAGFRSLRAVLRLYEGKISLKSFTSPLDHLNADVVAQGAKLTLKNISANFAKGSLKVSGVVDQWTTQALSSFHLSAQELSMQALLPPSGRNTPPVSGHLSVDFGGSASGLSWPQISGSLSGQGRLVMKDGVLVNLNILRRVVDKLSVIPGIGEAVKNRIPEEYRAKLNEPNTILQPLDWPVTVQSGKIYFQNLSLVTDAFAMGMTGELGLDKNVNAAAALWIHPSLSAAMVGAAPQLQLLLDARGQIEVPLQIQGVLPNAAVLPDRSLTDKFSAYAAQQVIGGLAQGKSGKQILVGLLSGPSAQAPAQGGAAQAPASGTTGDSSGASNFEDLLKAFSKKK